jgi:septum formation protein
LELILASTSPYRRNLIERLGLPFSSVPPGVDEAVIQAQGDRPRALAERLALEKALAVARSHPEATVIGSDQIALIDGTILGKPGTVAQACAQLDRLEGRTHDLITALCVWSRNQAHRHIDVTRLTMRSLTADEVRRYVDADLPLDCAGAYKIEGRGIVLFERVETQDPTAITGLPLMALTTILRRLGFPVP